MDWIGFGKSHKMYKILFLMFMLISVNVQAQHELRIKVEEKGNHEVLPGATVLLKGERSLTTITDDNGNAVFLNLPVGEYVLQTNYLGFETSSDTVNIPYNGVFKIHLQNLNDEMEEVVITSTRSSRTIGDIATRVEFIAGEELEEKANMKPGDIRVLLSESTGIQTQITSATSGNAAIRIQGLDGRYTQLLKDGLPLYSGAASGLGLLQIPPLDLKQVEIVKGSTSTLYGGGAIAGLVNLISKTPQKESELSFILNGTGAGGFDASGFYAKRNDKIGTTVFFAHNSNKAYDPSDVGFSAIPNFSRITFNPKLFLYPTEKTSLNFGINTSFEDRIGGDMDYLKNRSVTNLYFEKNKTERLSTQLELQYKWSSSAMLNIKNSVSLFNRNLQLNNYGFSGQQTASFTEASVLFTNEKMEWVAGLNLWTDNFKDKSAVQTNSRTYEMNTLGAFIQNTFKASDNLHVESGLRTDYVFDYGAVVLPRVSLLYKINANLSSRLGGGFGYKQPTIFIEEAERIHYDVSFNRANSRLEKSYGANWDVNYKTPLFNNKVMFSINQLFFYTIIDNPLDLSSLGTGNPVMVYNRNGNLTSKGIETNVKFVYDHFKLFLGYTFTDARVEEGNFVQQNYLTPKHRVNSVLFYEVHDQWKIGLEAYYFDRQKLRDAQTGRSYWMTGFMVEKIFERFSVYINFENFTDSRQTRFDSIYEGTKTNPLFRDIYAPLEGFVVNGGLKIRL